MTMRRFRRQRRRPAPTTDRRSPELRLEAMVREQDDDRRERMLERILDELTGPRVIEWLAATSTLRDRLVIGDDETYHLARVFAESSLFSGDRSDAELLRIGEQLDAIAHAHGLRPGEAFSTDEAPDDWLELDEAWGARADELMAQLLRDGGLADVAHTLLRQRARFDERDEEGRRRIWGSDDGELADPL